MLWIVLRTFLAWGSARLIKKFLFKTDFGKPIAIVLAVIWGIIWGIAAAFAFEYIFGEGTFNNKTLVPSIIFTSFAAYYAFIAKEFNDSTKRDIPAPLPLKTESASIKKSIQIKRSTGSLYRKLFLVKSGFRVFISLATAILLFVLILAGNISNMRPDLDYFIPFCTVVGLTIFSVLLAGRGLLVEKNLGWKRLSIVLSMFFTIISLIYVFLIKDDFHQDEFVILVVLSLLLIPSAMIIFIIKGKILIEWIRDGFSVK